jgi:hypothetical protein
VTGDGDNVLIPDSKDPDGPGVSFTRAEWPDFVAGAKDGDFDSLLTPPARCLVGSIRLTFEADQPRRPAGPGAGPACPAQGTGELPLCNFFCNSHGREPDRMVQADM